MQHIPINLLERNTPLPTGPTPGRLTHLCTLIRAACKAFRCFSLGPVFFFYWWRNYIISICASNQSADLFFSTVSFSNQSADFFLVAESVHSQEPIKMTGAYDYDYIPEVIPSLLGVSYKVCYTAVLGALRDDSKNCCWFSHDVTKIQTKKNYRSYGDFTFTMH